MQIFPLWLSQHAGWQKAADCLIKDERGGEREQGNLIDIDVTDWRLQKFIKMLIVAVGMSRNESLHRYDKKRCIIV